MSSEALPILSFTFPFPPTVTAVDEFLILLPLLIVQDLHYLVANIKTQRVEPRPVLRPQLVSLSLPARKDRVDGAALFLTQAKVCLQSLGVAALVL